MSGRQHGFVLIAVLWLIAVLTIVALGYARTTRYKAQEISNELILAQEDQLFASGLEMAGFQYQLYAHNRERFVSSALEDMLTPEQRAVMWYPRYETYPLVMEEHELFVRVEPVDARMALESMTGELWYAVLGACGVEDEGDRLAIISAIADWQDADSLVHIDGAEQEYYSTLTPAYACKNAPMETLEELMLVRGITPKIFYGSKGRPGLRHFLCLDGSSTHLDLNCAAPETLHLVEGISPQEIAAIVELRQNGPITNLAEAQELVSLVVAGELGRFFYVASQPKAVRLTIAWDPDPGPEVRSQTRIVTQ